MTIQNSRTSSSGIAEHAQGSNTWHPDWDAIAEQMVARTVRLQRGERVVYIADPYLFPEFLESVRLAVLRAGGVEQAAILNWSPRLAAERTRQGLNPSEELALGERSAHRDLLHTSDVMLWLPNEFSYPGAYAAGESEWILDSWRGRGIHSHWFPDPGSERSDPVNRELERIYERGILAVDYVALADRQRRLVDEIRGRTLRLTTPEGTDLSFDLPADGWYHCNDGDMSLERAKQAVCARDREHELPCGAVRSIPAPSSAEGIISFRKVPAWNGSGLAVSEFGSDLDLVFRGGHIVELRGGEQQAALDGARQQLQGDWDRLGEIIIGTNPELDTPPGAVMPTYWGYGAGVFRLSLGDNLESGGRFHSELAINLILPDATLSVDGNAIIHEGRLLFD